MFLDAAADFVLFLFGKLEPTFALKFLQKLSAFVFGQLEKEFADLLGGSVHIFGSLNSILSNEIADKEHLNDFDLHKRIIARRRS